MSLVRQQRKHAEPNILSKKVDEIGKLRYSDGTAVFLVRCGFTAAFCLQGTNGGLEGRSSMDHFVLHSESSCFF